MNDNSEGILTMNNLSDVFEIISAVTDRIGPGSLK